MFQVKKISERERDFLEINRNQFEQLLFLFMHIHPFFFNFQLKHFNLKIRQSKKISKYFKSTSARTTGI